MARWGDTESLARRDDAWYFPKGFRCGHGVGGRCSCMCGSEDGLVVGGWWLVAGGWWLVVDGWWLVVGGWWWLVVVGGG